MKHPLFPNPIISSFPNLAPPSRCRPHTTHRPKPNAPAPPPTTFVPPVKPARWSPHATASQTPGVPPSASISSSAVRDRGASSAHHPPLRSSCAVHSEEPPAVLLPPPATRVPPDLNRQAANLPDLPTLVLSHLHYWQQGQIRVLKLDNIGD